MIRLIATVVMLALIGCSAVPNIPTQVQMADTTIRTIGGTFSATYSGNYSLRDCEGQRGHFQFTGSGSGSFIHSSTEKGSLYSGDHGCGWNGPATLTSSAHPRNSIAMTLNLGNFTFGNPCHPRFAQKVKFIVVGGTGRFINAMGAGTVAFTCNNDGTYTDNWSGTITY